MVARPGVEQRKKFDELFMESGTTILDEVQRLRRIVGEFAQFALQNLPRSALR